MKRDFLLPIFMMVFLISVVTACKKSKNAERLAVVETGSATVVSHNQAKVGGNVTADGGTQITERGICWALTSFPTVDNNKMQVGNGTGTFEATLEGLIANTEYHARAYVINAVGTSYGENITFKTSRFQSTTVGFKVCGTKIYDPSGKEFIIKGTNISGPGFSWPESTVNQFDNVVNKWKFNAIRLATKGGPALDNYTDYSCSSTNFPEYKYTTFGTMNEIVKKYTDAKIVVMIEWHQVGGIFTGSDLTCATNWWVKVAEAYKDNPYVWFDLYNEPQTSSHDIWASSMQTVINAIRATGSTNVIVATGNYWGQDANTWSCNNVPQANSAILSKTLSDPVDNLAYAIHVYDQWDQCQAKLDDFVSRVQAQNKCLIIGEYGVYNNSALNNAHTYTLTTAQNKKIGRMVWAWFGGDRNDLTTSDNGGGQHSTYNTNGVPTNLSILGQAVWNDLNRTETLADKPTSCN